MPWYCWTKVPSAEIDDDLRNELEQHGTQVVAMTLALPLTVDIVRGLRVSWVLDGRRRAGAFAWLREKHLEDDRRKDINEAMEVAIIVLVAIESLATVMNWIRHGF